MKRLTVEQEAGAILAKMARLTLENREATGYQCAALAKYEEAAELMRAEIAKVNAQRDGALARLEARARDLGLRAEGTIKTEHGKVAFKAGYARVTYDAKGLDAVAKVPEHGWLRQYRSETHVPPSVKVEVREDGP